MWFKNLVSKTGSVHFEAIFGVCVDWRPSRIDICCFNQHFTMMNISQFCRFLDVMEDRRWDVSLLTIEILITPMSV